MVTPHLGPGGAESVFLEIAAANSADSELLVIATQSNDSRWEKRWRDLATGVYDLAAVVAAERVPAALLPFWSPGASMRW
jgi:hypothetical protein